MQFLNGTKHTSEVNNCIDFTIEKFLPYMRREGIIFTNSCLNSGYVMLNVKKFIHKSFQPWQNSVLWTETDTKAIPTIPSVIFDG